MKIGFCALSWIDPPGDIDRGWLAELKSMGYHGIEIPIMRGARDDYARLADEIDAAGLARTALTAIPHGKNPISEDAPERQAAMEHIAWALHAARALGAAK